MSGADTAAFRYRQFLLSLPGKRGLDIPEHEYDASYAVASGITQPLWGRAPTPHQMQALHDMGAVTPQAIHDAFAALPHPHAPSLTVGEYGAWKDAHKAYTQHR